MRCATSGGGALCAALLWCALAACDGGARTTGETQGGSAADAGDDGDAGSDAGLGEPCFEGAMRPECRAAFTRWDPGPVAVTPEDGLCGLTSRAPGVLLPVTDGPADAQLVGDRLLIITEGWSLWDTAQRKQLARGAWHGAGARPRLAGNTLAIPVQVVSEPFPSGSIVVELRSARDGALRATVSVPAYGFELAPDGSYLWSTSDAGLFAWSDDGRPLLTREGSTDYVRGVAVPGELRIANVPTDLAVVQRVSLADGSETRSPPFRGEFAGWFDDGARFTTTEWTRLAGDDSELRVRVYALSGALEQTYTFRAPAVYPQLGGWGDTFWRVTEELPSTLIVYRVSTGAEVLSSVLTSPLRREGSVVGFQAGEEYALLDLAATEPVVQRVSRVGGVSWAGAARENGAVAAISGGEPYWSASGRGDDWERVGCGRLRALAGASTGRVAVATGDGRTRLFELTGGEPEGALGLALDADKLALSRDGRVLAARDRDGVRVHALPGGELLTAFRTPPETTFHDFALARAAPRLGLIACGSSGGCRVEVHTLEGLPLWRTELPARCAGQEPCAQVALPTLSLSPSGARMALSGAPSRLGSATLLYENGQRVGLPVDGDGIGWIDDERLLVTWSLTPIRGAASVEVRVIDAQGQLVRVLRTVPPSGDGQAIPSTLREVDARHFYLVEPNTLYDSVTLQEMWRGPLGVSRGDVAGAHVVFGAPGALLFQLWQTSVTQ